MRRFPCLVLARPLLGLTELHLLPFQINQTVNDVVHRLWLHLQQQLPFVQQYGQLYPLRRLPLLGTSPLNPARSQDYETAQLLPLPDSLPCYLNSSMRMAMTSHYL
jgi:hypothetical protein